MLWSTTPLPLLESVTLSVLLHLSFAFVKAVFASSSVSPVKSGTSTCSIPKLTFNVISVPASTSSPSAMLCSTTIPASISSL